MNAVNTVKSSFSVDALKVNAIDRGLNIVLPRKGKNAKVLNPVFEGVTYIVNVKGVFNRFIKKQNKLAKIGNSINDKNKINRFNERLVKKYENQER